jgi:hypothetical protein
VPYGWQFPGEDVHIPVEKAYKINMLGFINRKSQYMGMMTQDTVNAGTVIEFPEKLSFLFATFEYCRNDMEKTQERMAESGRLSGKGQTLLRH